MASGSEVDWSACVQSLIAASCSSFKSNNLPELLNALTRCENDILQHEPESECFYSAFAALATHYVCQNVKAFGNGNMSDATAACKVLLKYLLDRLKHQHDECTINKKTLMVLIGSLCKGSSSLPKSDVVTFTALLKAAKPPPNIRSKETEEVAEPKDVKRPRLDTGTNIFDQLTSVFHELPTTGKQDSPIDMISGDGESGTLPEANEEAKTVFSNKNIQTLQILDGANVLLDVCLQLIYIKRYKNRYLDTLRGEEFIMPNSIGDAVAIRNSFHLLLTDISVVWKAFSLPILEPLTPQRLEKVITVAMTCLYTAITVTTATSMVAMAAGMQVKGVPVTKDQDELDAHATGIVQKSLAVFNSVCQAVRSSTKAGGHALQNLHLLGSWFLMMGLQNLMNWSPQLVVEKGVGLKAKPKEAPKDTTSTSSKSGSPKSYPGFGVLGVALASKAIGLLSALLEDVNVESLVSMNTPPSTPESAGLNIEGQYKAAQRVHRLINDVPLANMLFSMLTVAFKKATSIKKQKSGQEPTDTSCSSSDSNTYYEDDFSSSEDSSDEDEDSEPLFGQWFEETLSPGEKLIMVPSPSPPTVPEAETKPEPTEKAGSEGPQIVPDKKEPDGYISLATDILQLMNTQILGSPDTTNRDYISQSLNAQHMAGLADVIKGLDKECSCGEQAKLYEEFSSALSRFSHSIIATELLSESMQDCLLAELGLDPLAEDPWPMTVQPRTLSVLCSILLQRQQKERQSELVRSKSEAAIVNIWTRFLTTLKASVFVLTLEIHNLENVEDVNVEHLQLLLLLFHSLPLLQKKTLLLQLSQQVTSITEQLCADDSPDSHETPLLPVTRMVLILDYLLHNFYDPPAALMDQVQWNLYGCFVAGSAARGLSDNIFKTHFPCNEVEENYRKSQKINQLNKAEADQTLNTTFILNGNQDSMKPRFYNLSPSDYSSQDVPKVDGLACSFLLGNPDVLSYNSLYSACISLLLMGSRLDLGHRCSALEACALHYHFHVTWRLLACLPPSTQYLMTLESGTVPNMPAMVMHTLRWASRLGHKAFSVWAKDCLVRQGMTTQDASFLVTRVSTVTNTVLFDVKLVLNYIQGEISVMPLAARGDIIPQHSLPTMFTVMMLDAVIAKVQVALDDLFTKSMVDTDPHKAMSIATDFLPATFLLIEEYMLYIKSFLLNKITSPSAGEDQQEYTKSALQAYSTVISISSAHASKVSVLGMAVSSWLPGPVRTALEKWGSNTATEFPSVSAYRNAYANDIIPSESYIDAILTAHMGSLSSSLDLTAGLKHLMHALVRFSSDLIIWCPDDGSSKELVRVLFPLMYDSTTEYIADNVCSTLEKFLGSVDSDTFITKMYQHVISKCHHLLINHSDPDSGLDERILHDCLKFLETHLDKPQAKTALERFYKDRADLVNVLLSTGNEHLGPVYGTKVLKFFEKLLQLAEKNPGDKSYETLCASLGHLAQVERDRLMKWLSKMVLAPLECTDDTSTLQENRRLLQSLTSYLVKDNSHIDEEVAKVILKALILLAVGECGGTGFPELMVVMQTLASAGAGEGYLMLLWAATDWLQDCKKQIKEAGLTEKFHEKVSSGQHQPLVESVCCLLSYISDILGAVRFSSDSKCGLASPPYDGEVTTQDGDSDWAEEVGPEEEESDGEDSDEESLNNKLCTFTVTQKEFMNQHWYHCHTCKMVDGMGVCNVCAKVCHKDHELSYAKYGSFFCDCGAKEDGSCQALVKRTGSSGMDSSGPASGASPFSGDVTLPSSLRRRLSSPTQMDSAEVSKSSSKLAKAREAICRQIEGYKSNIVIHMQESGVVNIVLELLTSVMPSVVENYQCTSSVGSRKRALKALQDLHTLDKRCETSDQLMTATLGSQEGAFENVKMNYSGDQGQTIRQLIQSHVLRRVAMCCMTSPTGKRQHLAVSHEKGKITILQLSALLKQADSSKRKLTLTRLTSAPVPFTVLSMAGNPCNEDVLAVCGLKECHVLTFSSSGSVGDHIVLHPSLETGNFIIKAVWLPGSQTELAIVTANFVKVYDLSEDVISPVFYYLLPSGKIRDTTFMFTEEGRHLLVMSSTGYIYTQQMDEESSAQHGPFYITNILEIDHPDIKEANGQVAGGGVSVYYSHALQLLFLSYSQGKSFVAPVPKDLQQLTKLFSLTWKTNGGKAGHQQPLVQWMEVANHPGLVCSMTQTSNNPVIIMLDPCTFVVQEIKVMPAKAKIQDMVALRHTGSSAEQHRTTLILLCEDGSLRIYMANVDNTGYWMSPLLQPQSILSSLKPARKKKTTKSSRSRQPEALTFPIDFFENCQQTNDLEFGGNDVLQVYNTAQVKHRLNTNGMYIASTKQAGFSLDIMNTNNSNVMVGVRVLVGSQAVERAPSYLEVFGRTTQVNTLRSRWYDLPFTREESLTADKKFTLFLGASVDPAGVTMVDSIKVYVKTKEAFGWPEETEDFPDPAAPGPKPVPVGLSSNNNDTEGQYVPSVPLSLVDHLLSSSLEVLDCAAVVLGTGDEKDSSRQTALDLATRLLTLPTPASVQQPTRALLSSLFTSRGAYYNHRDQALLSNVVQLLQQCQETQDDAEAGSDPEAFQRLVVTARSVAVARPANLVRFIEKDSTLVAEPKSPEMEVTDLEGDEAARSSPEEPASVMPYLLQLEESETQHFMVQLLQAFWKLHASRPKNISVAPPCLPGLTHIEATVAAMVEIIHGYAASDLDNVALASKLYVKLLLCEDSSVSFACKQALIRVLRPKQRKKRVFIPSPPHCSTPEGRDGEDEEEDTEHKVPDSIPPPADEPLVQQPPVEEPGEQYEIVDPPESMVLGPPVVNAPPPQPSPLEALLDGGGNFPPLLDIPPDADDEAMVELAIALSLQDQAGQGSGLNLQGLQLGIQGQGPSSLGEGHLSDTTASAPGSDDEVGSTAATDGSTLRTSPAEHGGSAGSESGGSAIESISGEHNVSGRSSLYGDGAAESATTGARSETSSVGAPSGSILPEGEVQEAETQAEIDSGVRLHTLRLLMLDHMLKYLPEIHVVGGVGAIPFMQVLLMLSSDLDSEEEKDKAALTSLLTALMAEIKLPQQDVGSIDCRTARHEVVLVTMRLLSVLMSRTKAGTKPSTETSSFVSTHTAGAMLENNVIELCLEILKTLLKYWKTLPEEEEGTVVGGQLLKPQPTSSPPDMSPFFLRQYVKGHASDVFEAYPQLLTEMVLRLPYQMKKIADSAPHLTSPVFDQAWYNILCEYMLTPPQTPFVKRQVRKLLLFICGSKEHYRQTRDMHSLETHMGQVRELCKKEGFDMTTESAAPVLIPYDTLINLMEHLKACSEIATSRVVNWQSFCQKDDTVLPFLVTASISLDEGVAPVLLQLLQCALCGVKALSQQGSSSSSPSKKKNKDKDKEEASESDDNQKHDEALCQTLVQQVSKFVTRELLIKFIRAFLLESNSTAVRWQAHALILHIYRCSPSAQQDDLLVLMWALWCELPAYGRKGAQFVDLLGYFALKASACLKKRPNLVHVLKPYVEKAVAVLRRQNNMLANHPNASIYNALQGLVEVDGYFLESDPCLVCNNPEVPYTNIKLSAIKVDSKFTTTTQIVKLFGSYNISKIAIRISDLKRTKMVRTINIYYNNRAVQAVVELKNRPGIWHKAKKVTLTAGQTDIKVEFPLPIVACNLMIEYADFYDNLQGTTETLQCPRCSASVPANPGVCGNCGENVFQCHKCRSINYDEKDPFLCNACGFCKYAKFDFSLTARPCSAVDPIENDEDRKKAVSTINSLLEKADKLYRQVQVLRPGLEGLLFGEPTLSASAAESAGTTTTTTTPSGTNANANTSPQVKKTIYQIAQKYQDCRTTYEELSKVIQRVLASRKELVEYDRQQKEAVLAAAVGGSSNPTTPVVSPRGGAEHPLSRAREVPSCDTTIRERTTHCYGCASATVELCVTLLRALATDNEMRAIFCSQGLIPELVRHNLCSGTQGVRQDVKQLLCVLTKDSVPATDELNNILLTRIKAVMTGQVATADVATAVKNEIGLLAATIEMDDSLWERRIRCVLQLFLVSMELRNPVIMENITLPCLRILHRLINPEPPTSKKYKEKTIDALTSVSTTQSEVHCDVQAWLRGDPGTSFTEWQSKMAPKAMEFITKKKKDEKTKDRDIERRMARIKYLMEKYGQRWRNKIKKADEVALSLVSNSWLKQALFSPSSKSARQTACQIIEAMCQVQSRKKIIIDMLTGYLDELGKSGECAGEFLALYKKLISPGHWIFYLAVKGILPKIASLITKEIENLTSLEETTLSSDLTQGFALKALTELMSTLVEQEEIKQHYKNRLVGSVLGGYLSLRKLVVQRTKLIDDTQEKLLELLEQMTTGTESETKEFMSVCVETVNKYPMDDFRSPAFIFERLCSIIYPEENDVGEFFMILEKDPQQEDFLQGRMLGNPYSSSEPGLGPLMRDVKNKICQDCELIALLEDDTGMELLVNNKIISLDLPVKDVYKKVWLADHNEGEPMRVVYRMRGLLGDATEDMVNSLDSGKDDDVDEEEVYKMAGVLAQCGGLNAMLNRLSAVHELVTGKQLMQVLLKLFSYCVKVKVNRDELIKPAMNSISIMLGALNLALLAEQEAGVSTKGQTMTEQILQIMETVLQEASSSLPQEQYKRFSDLCGDHEQLMMLLDRINSPFVRANAGILQALMRLIPFLAFGDQEKMAALVNHFKPYCNFNKYDFEHNEDEQIHIDCFCAIAQSIEKDANGQILKDMIQEQGIVKEAVEYIQMHAPQVKTLLATDSEDWKELISKPALPFSLRLLTGLSRGHPKIQVMIGQDCIRILHKLEQVSSDEHIGSLAENLMESLRENPEVAAKIEEIRHQTKAEKKKLAMAMRQKQLGALGMKTNEKGQVMVKSSLMKQVEDLKEETGVTCCICREGYRCQPNKVLGIYTFTKRVNLEDFELKQRKTQGYCTVTHFNTIHVDCHLAAVRHARGREEWTSAELQNTNTKCNGLLPLWGPEVPESAFASCLARHNTYLQEATGVRDTTYSYTIHDLKHLLLRFAQEKSFSADSGGGGRQSNMYIIPYIMHMALYVLNTTRSVAREEKNLNNFLKASPDKWVENAYEVEGVLYWLVIGLHILGRDGWKEKRLDFLKRLVATAHIRAVSPGGAQSLKEKEPREYSSYKSYLVFFGLVDGVFNLLYKKVTSGVGETWAGNLAEYIRSNDQQMQEAGDKLLASLEEEMLPCESFSEYCDVMGFLEQIPNPDSFLQDLFTSIP